MIRDRGVDPELLDQLDDMLRRAEDQGLNTLSEKEIMFRLKRHWPDKKSIPSLPEVRRALQALVMDESNMPNTVYGPEMKSTSYHFGPFGLGLLNESPVNFADISRTLPVIKKPTSLDSNLTVGLGQN